MNLQDNREYQAMTAEQADDLFIRMARAKARIDREAAAHKARIAALEEAHRQKVRPDMEEYEALSERLTAYILANPLRFARPRKRQVGAIGTYGVTTDPAYVQVTDKEAYLDFALERGYADLYRVEYTPDKAGAMARLANGEEIPGARVVPAGDVAKVAFKKGFAEQLEG